MLELKRPLNGLKKNHYVFQDMSDNADNTFKVTDLSDKFLLGKNSFKLHLKEDILVFRSQVYIDILDSFGNPVYYKIISDNLPNKERIVAVYVYDSTPVGDCEIIIAGRLAVNPNTGIEVPYSNDTSSPDYHGIPNVVWRRVVQINTEESEDKIYYSVPPTITYSEVRKPQYQLSTNNRLVSLTPTSSGRATMYSNRGQLATNETIKVVAGGHLLNPDTSSATFIPITPVNNDNEIASLYFSGFTLSSSMERGRIYVNNIPYQYPREASITQSRVINYSGSIVKVVSENLCYVNPPLYQILPYTDIYGNSKDLVVSGFSEVANFTASFRTEPTITTDTSSYNSYIRLQIKNTEPEIGSVKSVSVKAKQINKPGKVVDLGTFKVENKNILVVDSSTYTMTSKGIEPLSLGNFRKLGTVTNYWTGSNTIGFVTDFTNDTNVLDGVKYPSTEYVMQSDADFAEFRLKSQYYPTVYADTEYQLTFDLLFQNKPNLVVPRQVDVYISGSGIKTITDTNNAVLPPLKKSRFGTYIGSIDTTKTSRHAVKMYFTAEESGAITPVFVNRSISNIYGNIELSVRNEPGYSSKFLDLEIPLPSEFSSRSELELEVDYLNSKNEGANYKSSLYGVVFEGNTPTTVSSSGGSTTIPPGTVSGSDQLTSSFDNRYERKGTGIISSSGQIGSDISGSFTSLSSSLSRRIYSLEQTTGSLNTFTGSANSRLNSIELVTGSLNSYTGSNNTRLNIIEQTTGSLNTFTGSANTRLNSIETKTGSYATTGSNTFIGNQKNTGSIDVSGSLIAISITGSFSGSFQGMPSSSAQIKALLPTGVASGSEQLTSSYDTRYERKGTGIVSSSAQIGSDVSGSFTDVSSSLSKRVYSIEQTTGSLNTFTGSASTRLSNIELTTGSLNTYTGSNNTRLNIIEQTTGSLNNYTGSNNTRLNTIEQTTGSLNTYTGSANTRFNNLETKTGSYATTGSNTFKADQTISGSLIVTGSFTVNRATGSFSGSFDGQYSSSQQVNYDQITNKPNLLTPGQYRVLTSDGTPSGSQASKDFTYISSSTINRVRQMNMSEQEFGISSSFWSTNLTFVTQSILNLSIGTNNVFIDFPVYKDSEGYSPITSSIHHVSYAVRVETHIYAISGTLALPRNFYNWAHTIEYRGFQNPGTLAASIPISGLTMQTSSRNNSGSFGGYGTTYTGRPDINSWVSILGVTDLGDGRMQLRTQMTPTQSGWTAYIGSTCRVMKHEIRI